MSRTLRMLLMLVLLGMALGCVSGGTPVPLVFEPAELPEATAGEPYRAMVTVSGAETPLFDMRVDEGELPEGLSWHYDPDAGAAEISGVPVAAGTYQFSVTASCLGTSRDGQKGVQVYSLVVR